jgi:hypothetical protein
MYGGKHKAVTTMYGISAQYIHALAAGDVMRAGCVEVSPQPHAFPDA